MVVAALVFDTRGAITTVLRMMVMTMLLAIVNESRLLARAIVVRLSFGIRTATLSSISHDEATYECDG